MLQNLRNIISTGGDEYAELVTSSDIEVSGKIPVFVDSLNSFADSERLLRKCREGGIVFARIGHFKNTNIAELKRTLARIKTVSTAMGGEIVSVADEWIVLTPSNGTIVR